MYSCAASSVRARPRLGFAPCTPLPLLPNPDRKVLESLTDFTGTGKVLQTSLSKDSEEALRKVFEAKS